MKPELSLSLAVQLQIFQIERVVLVPEELLRKHSNGQSVLNVVWEQVVDVIEKNAWT